VATFKRKSFAIRSTAHDNNGANQASKEHSAAKRRCNSSSRDAFIADLGKVAVD